MAIGPRARDPNTPYAVYEFSVNGKVYYAGMGQKSDAGQCVRATDRWNWVRCQLERLKREGTLPPGKMKSIAEGHCAVIRAMIERGMKPHDISYTWDGLGRDAALHQEGLRIRYLLEQGCMLANRVGNTRPASVAEVLRYLGIQ